MFPPLQQLRNDTPIPTVAGTKATLPEPLTLRVPVKPKGAEAGVIMLLFEVPDNSEGSPAIRSTVCNPADVVNVRSPVDVRFPEASRENALK